MRTDHAIFFNNTTSIGNFTTPVNFELVNGTGYLHDGYVSAVCQVQGLDLILEVMIVQMILQMFILAALYHFTTKVDSS